MFDFTLATVIYCALVGGLFLVLWICYDRRDHGYFEADRRKTAFHCVRCEALYAAPKGRDLAPCPKCGHENHRLRF